MAVISLSVKPSVKIVHRNFQFLFGNRAPPIHATRFSADNWSWEGLGTRLLQGFQSRVLSFPCRLLTDVLGMSQTKLTSLLGSPSPPQALVAYFTKLIYNPGFNFIFQIVNSYCCCFCFGAFVYLRKVVRYDAAGKWCANSFTEGER